MKKLIKKIKSILVTSLSGIRVIWDYDPVYVLLLLAIKLFKIASLFIGIYMVKSLVAFVSEDYRLGLALARILAISFTYLILELVANKLTNISNLRRDRLLIRVKEAFARKCIKMDYASLSSKDLLDLKERALFAFEKNYLTKNLDAAIGLIGSLLALSGLIYMVSSLGLLLIIPFIVSVTVRVISDFYKKKVLYLRGTEVLAIKRKTSYLGKLASDFKYAKDIRLFDLKDRFYGRMEEVSEEKHLIKSKMFRMMRICSYVYHLGEFFLEWMIYAVLGYKVIVTKVLSVSQFAFQFAAIKELMGVLSQVTDQVSDIYINRDYVQDFLSFFETPAHGTAQEDLLRLEAKDRILVEFKQVSFKYPDTDAYVIRDLNLRLESGQTYLFVGENGAGKTTIMKLLCRLYEPSEGVILLNGESIHKYSAESYYEHLAVLFQDYKMFPLSVKENITGLDSSVVDNRYQSAKSRSRAQAVIDRLSQADDTQIYREFSKTGVELSGGEMQRLAIARNFYSRSRIQIFDEPTSALDAETEYKLFMDLSQNNEDRLHIFVSHRLTSSKFCDNVIMIDGGTIVGMGNHHHLLGTCHKYRDLFDKQSILYSGSNDTCQTEEVG